MRPRFVKQDQIAIVRLDISGGMSCIENFKDFPQMGRFTLRDEGKNCIIYYMFLISEFSCQKHYLYSTIPIFLRITLKFNINTKS